MPPEEKDRPVLKVGHDDSSHEMVELRYQYRSMANGPDWRLRIVLTSIYWSGVFSAIDWNGTRHWLVRHFGFGEKAHLWQFAMAAGVIYAASMVVWWVVERNDRR